MTTKTLRAVDTPLDPDRDDVVVLPARGRQRKKEHPALGPLPSAMNWLMDVRYLMRHQKMSLYEADQIVINQPSHDGKGRRFQPSGQR